MAKSRIGNLFVTLGLNSKAFVKGLAKATGHVRIFSKRLSRNLAGVTKWGAGLATVASGALTLMVRRSMSSIDALAKTADKLGVTTQALAGMGHAAELSGVGVDKFQMGLQRMTRRVAEAAKGTGEAKAAIAELGLDAQQLARLSPDKQFMAIADAMEQVNNQADRVRLGFKLFDSEGVAIINTLRGGSQQLKQMQADALNLGISFNRIEAKRIENANDAVTRLGQVLKGAGNILAQRVAPFIEHFADQLTRAGTEGEGMRGVIDSVLQSVKGIARFVTKIIDPLMIMFEGLRWTMAKVMAGIARGVTNVIKTLNNLPFVNISTDFTEALTEDLNRQADEFAAKIGKIIDNSGRDKFASFDDLAARVQAKSDARAQLPFAQTLAQSGPGGLVGAGNAAVVQLLQQIADANQQVVNNTRDGMGAA